MVDSGNSTEVDELTDELNRKEGRNIEARDFTDHDFTVWVYVYTVLKRPIRNVAFILLGRGSIAIFSFQVGLLRECTFLRHQAQLQWLNLLEPHLIALKDWHIPTSTSLRFNPGMGHMLTSFRYTVDTHLFMQRNLINLIHCWTSLLQPPTSLFRTRNSVDWLFTKLEQKLLLRTRSLDATQRTELLHQSSCTWWIIRANDLPSIIRPLVCLL